MYVRTKQVQYINIYIYIYIYKYIYIFIYIYLYLYIYIYIYILLVDVAGEESAKKCPPEIYILLNSGDYFP